MDPDQIAKLLASGDKEQIKEAQRLLQAKGHYKGRIDGSLGKNPSESATMSAARAYSAAEAEKEARRRQAEERDAAIREETARAEAASKKAGAKKETAEAEEIERKSKAREEYDRQAMSPLGLATQSAATLAPPAITGAIGLKAGEKVNEYLDRGQEKRNVDLRGAAEDRVKGLTTREGAVTGTRLAGAMPPSNPLLRVGSRMAPHMGLGALSIGKGVQLLSDVDEEQPFYPRMADRAAGLGYIGFGAGLAKRGLQYAASPGVSPDAQALSVINSNRLIRNNQNQVGAPVNRGQIIDAETVPDTPPPQRQPSAPTAFEPAPGSRAYYAQEAKRLGVKGISRMNKADLVQAVNEANQNNATRRVRTKTPKAIPGIAGPAIAAGLAYMATPDDAMAADGSMTGQDRALTNAAIAGGGYAGANRLLQALPSNARQFGGRLLSATAAPMAATDITSEIVQRRAPLPGQEPPGFMETVGGVASDLAGKVFLGQSDADDSARMMRDMSQVPDRNPMFSDPRPIDPRLANDQQLPGMVHGGGDDFDAQLAELSALMSEFDVPETRQAPPMPQFQIPAPMQQNQLLAR